MIRSSWLQALMLLVMLVQPLTTFAMPCHLVNSSLTPFPDVGAAVEGDTASVGGAAPPARHHGAADHHDSSVHQHPDATHHHSSAVHQHSTTFSNEPDSSAAPVAQHSCCGAGAVCLMSGCMPSPLSPVISLASASGTVQLADGYRSAVPDAPVSSLYRPPIFL